MNFKFNEFFEIRRKNSHKSMKIIKYYRNYVYEFYILYLLLYL